MTAGPNRSEPICPVVPLRQWRRPYPSVDREYVWLYPLVREGAFDPQSLFSEPSVPLTSREVVLYFHIPACKFHCPMCPFYHEIIQDRSDLAGYATALEGELRSFAASPAMADMEVTCVYFGGGTASLLPATDVGRLLGIVSDAFDVASGLEVTLEGHPVTLDDRYLCSVRDCGVTRLSMGVQSFMDRHLADLGLHQSCEGNRRAIRAARRAGFRTVAVDLIYRMPSQTAEEFEADLAEALSEGVNSISAYSLELSVAGAGSLGVQPDDEADRAMFYSAHDMLTRLGWDHMAPPDFAEPGHWHKEISVSWKAPQGQVLGIGAGAWSCFNGAVFCNVHDMAEYERVIDDGLLPILTGQAMTLDDAMSRYPVLGARCFDIPAEPFHQSFGVGLLDVFAQEIGDLCELGLIEATDRGVHVSRKGKYYVDNISKAFYTAANRCRLQPWGSRSRGRVGGNYFRPPGCGLSK